MATSDPIKGNDIVADNALKPAIAEAEQYLTVLTKIQGALKGQSKNAGDTVRGGAFKADTESIKAHTDALLKATQADRGLTETTKLQIDAQTKLNTLKAQHRQQLKDEIAMQHAAKDSITAMAIELRKVTQEWNNLSRAQAADPTNEVTKRKKELTEALSGLRQATGDHRMEVGKYAKAAQGLTGILHVLGEAFGLNTDALEKLKDAHKTLRESIRDLHHLMEVENEGRVENTVAVEANTVATEENTVATEAQAVANEEVGATWIAALGPLGIFLAAVGAVAVAVWAYISATQESIRLERERSVAVDGSIITDKKLRDEYNESMTVMNEVNNAYKILFGTMTEYEAKLSDIRFATKVSMQNIENETTEKIQGITSMWGEFKNSLKDAFTGQMQGTHSTAALAEVGSEAYDQREQAKIKENAQAAQVRLKAQQDEDKEREDKAKEAARKKAEELKKAQEEWKKIEDENAQRRVDILNKGIEKDLAAEDLRYAEMMKKVKGHHDAEQLEMRIHQQKIADIENEYEDKRVKDSEDAERKRLENIKKAEAELDALLKEKEKEQDEYIKLLNLQDENRKKAREKEAEETKKEQDSVLSAVDETLKAKNQKEQAALKIDTENLATEVQVQSALAAQGKKNSLDATIAAQKKAGEEQKALQRKQAQEQEAAALAKLFIDAESAFLKAGSNPAQAAIQALEQVGLAKGIATGLMASFFDGTADTGGPGGVDGRGGKYGILHPHEAVIPEKRNKEMPGLAKAWIDGDIDSYLMSIYMPKLAIRDEVVNDQKIGEAMADKIVDGVTEAIMNQPQTLTYMDGHDTIIESEKNGVKTKRIIKGYKIIRRA